MEILFSNEQEWEESLVFAAQVVRELQLASITPRHESPEGWSWYLSSGDSTFVFYYTICPCETTLVAADPESDNAVERLFDSLSSQDAHQRASSKSPDGGGKA
jgi:hypothetical protein